MMALFVDISMVMLAGFCVLFVASTNVNQSFFVEYKGNVSSTKDRRKRLLLDLYRSLSLECSRQPKLELSVSSSSLETPKIRRSLLGELLTSATMDKHHVTDFLVKARGIFRQPQISSYRKANKSEPPSRLEKALASAGDATSQYVSPNTTTKNRNLEYRRDRLTACQRELKSLRAANEILKRQLEQQQLEERIKTENLRIWQVLAIKELESRFEERGPTQCRKITEIETCQDIQYTAGAPKIMGAGDGTMQCLALFLTESLVKSMCQVIEETRELELAEEPYAAAKNEVGIGRDNVEYAKSMLEQAETKEQFEYFQDTLEKNESQMLLDIERRDILRDDFQLKKLRLEHSQAGLLSVLEQVLTESQLMPGEHEASHDGAQSIQDWDSVSERTQSEIAADVGFLSTSNPIDYD